jgi:phage baseplate assembly protein W
MAEVKTYTYSDISLYAGITQNALVFDEDSINQNILLILMTPIRSAWFNPTIGCMVMEYLFDPLDAFTAQKIRSEIMNVLPRNLETRVQITGVDVIPDFDNQNYYISIQYNVPSMDASKIVFNFNLARVQ